LRRHNVSLLRCQDGGCVFKDQVVSAVGEKLFAQVLRWVQVFARRIFPLAFALDRVETGGDPAVLDFDLRRRMGEFAFVLCATAFVALIFATNLQSQPTGVL